MIEAQLKYVEKNVKSRYGGLVCQLSYHLYFIFFVHEFIYEISSCQTLACLTKFAVALVAGSDHTACEGDLGARWTEPADSSEDDARMGQVL